MALSDIRDVAYQLALEPSDYDVHGTYRAKVRLAALANAPSRRARYILVTAITPTPAGEGKTVTSIGLAMGLNKIGRVATANIRQSSVGPTLGFKGGGAGGGAARIEPLDEALLGLGSDLFAVEEAHNMLAALVDDANHRGAVRFDPTRIGWRRVIDVDDRVLRSVIVGLGGKINGPARGTGFDITAASEVMAILAFARDLPDLRARLGRIVVGFDMGGRPVTAEMLKAPGAMTALMRDALQPNLMQTSEGTPAFVHAGPFGNVGPGVSSVVADRIALARADYVVTEAGFGADLGGEKFLDLKCAASGEIPDAVVLVATVRGIKSHAARFAISGSKPLPREIELEDMTALTEGMPNLIRHIENVRRYGLPVVVAINRFPTDATTERKAIREASLDAGASFVAEHSAFADGGEGCIELAETVEAACTPQIASFHPLFEYGSSAESKIETLATRVYGAREVAWDTEARAELERFVAAGYGHLPICMAKTHLSFAHDPSLKGAPSDYEFPIKGVRLAAGAGYLLALAGDIMTMPGLPADPRAAHIDVNEDGDIVGLS